MGSRGETRIRARHFDVEYAACPVQRPVVSEPEMTQSAVGIGSTGAGARRLRWSFDRSL
ncbi:uncharacterized protein LY79DRAFT_545131 [Colletotrichum navitas]|uniref:Uncharacterized protein n=1 Tax=Colletotrichum navitas TaxID=681940 RepID=A0AAD8V892_9PEZI|nr:uncharacterized protein LY79DRAFT_545131 [Colletotrichum navitas]KAK1596028.1 hypothetical protein LY79DRAFT_545131 [Colletotrichum navitas]